MYDSACDSVSAYAFHVRIYFCLLVSLCASKFAHGAYGCVRPFGGRTLQDCPRDEVQVQWYRQSAVAERKTE